MYAEPGGPGVRVDGGVYQGWNVPVEYDPLLAKLAVWAETRSAAIGRMARAISEYHVSGITTNLSLFARILQDERFRSGDLDTGFLETYDWPEPKFEMNDEARAAMIAATLSVAPNTYRNGLEAASSTIWRRAGRVGLQR
jgi:acetyl-CoA carboxylase biotin carboxylase subunit